jgi:hypothetical protein
MHSGRRLLKFHPIVDLIGVQWSLTCTSDATSCIHSSYSGSERTHTTGHSTRKAVGHVFTETNTTCFDGTKTNSSRWHCKALPHLRSLTNRRSASRTSSAFRAPSNSLVRHTATNTSDINCISFDLLISVMSTLLSDIVGKHYTARYSISGE